MSTILSLRFCWGSAEIRRNFLSDLTKDIAEVDMKHRGDAAPGATKQEEGISNKLQIGVLAFRSLWLLDHCRKESEPAGEHQSLTQLFSLIERSIVVKYFVQRSWTQIAVLRQLDSHHGPLHSVGIPGAPSEPDIYLEGVSALQLAKKKQHLQLRQVSSRLSRISRRGLQRARR
jgi:hypothetical protein